MARVAFVLADDFEDREFQVPYERTRDAGHDPVVIGTEAGAEVTGKRGEVTQAVDRAAADVSPEDFDALVVAGGYSPDHLRTDDDVVGFTRAMATAGKPVAFICHAGSLLIEAGVVDGRRVTSWPSIRTDLRNAGAEWVDDAVVVDGNLISSRNPDDLDPFTETLLVALADD